MTNMFKKSVLAIALAGMSAGAMAADLDAVDAKEFSSEFLTTVPVVTTAGATQGRISNATDRANSAVAFEYTMGANYAVNDTVTFTFSGAAVIAGSLPQEISNSTDGVAEAAADLVELSLISTEVTGGNLVAVYRVTTIGSAVNGTSGQVIEIGVSGATTESIFVKPRSLTDDLVVSYSAKTSTGLTLDNTSTTDKDTATLATVVTQFESLSATTEFDGVVDVDEERFAFDSALSDAGTFGVELDTPTTLPAVVTGVEYTVTGDFSWLLDEDGEVDTDIATIAATACGGVALEVEADQAVITCTNSTAPVLTVTPNVANETVIPHQDFTVAATVTFEAGTDAEEGTVEFAAVDAGSWTLNGSEVHIPYMPYGDTITQVINLNNAGTQTGDVTVEGFDRTGKAFGPVVVGSAAAGKQVALADAIKSALTTAGVATNERVSLTLVTNVPAADVTVYSAYNTSGNGARIVVNSSNGK